MKLIIFLNSGVKISKMKTLWIGVLFIIIPLCYAGDTQLYIDSVNGSDNSTDCTMISPCASVQGALHVFGNSEDDLTLNILEGTYSGSLNTNITFPSVKVTMQLSGSGDVFFDCGENYSVWAFYSISSFEISFIQIQNCMGGVRLQSDEELQVLNVNFYNVENCISFTGEDITVQSVYFNKTSSGVIIRDNATSVTINDCTFYDATAYSIDIEISSPINEFSIESSHFQSTGGIEITIDESIDAELTLSDLDFNSISTGGTINLTNGKWTVENIPIVGCNYGIYYTGTGNYTELNVDSVSISACNYGILFTAPGDIDIQESTLNTTYIGFISYQANFIEIEENCEIINSYTAIVIDMDSYFEGEFSSLTFQNTGEVFFNSSAGSNFTMNDITVTNPKERAFNINGGLWGFTNVDITGASEFSENGGAFYLQGIGSTYSFTDCQFTNIATSGNGGAIYLTEGAMAIDGGSFTNCSADTGGAIFALDYFALSINDVTFTSNSATNNGGAIDLESSTATGTNVYIEDTDFTSNLAYNGAAISCCSVDSCNITVVYDSDDTANFSNNNNTIGASGTDVTCQTTVGEFETAASVPNVDSPSSTSNILMWLGIILGILLVFILLIAAGIGVFFYRKRMTYTNIE